MAEVWDVVCGMKGNRVQWSSRSEVRGKDYYFCCDGCKGAFERAPEYHLQNFAEEHPGVDPTPDKLPEKK
jgi:YHS domain-containing protein